MKQPLRDTATQQARNRRVAARTDHDDVRSGLAGHVCDPVRGVRRKAGDQLERRVKSLVASLVDLTADFGLQLVLISKHRTGYGLARPTKCYSLWTTRSVRPSPAASAFAYGRALSAASDPSVAHTIVLNMKPP
jgi:hypothetical protein